MSLMKGKTFFVRNKTIMTTKVKSKSHVISNADMVTKFSSYRKIIHAYDLSMPSSISRCGRLNVYIVSMFGVVCIDFPIDAGVFQKWHDCPDQLRFTISPTIPHWMKIEAKVDRLLLSKHACCGSNEEKEGNFL